MKVKRKLILASVTLLLAFACVLVWLVALQSCSRSQVLEPTEKGTGPVSMSPQGFMYEKDCVDVYPTDIQPSDLECKENHELPGSPRVSIGRDIKIRGVEAPEEKGVTRVAIYGRRHAVQIRFTDREFMPEESWSFSEGEHIAIFVVPDKYLDGRYWEEIKVEWYEPLD